MIPYVRHEVMAYGGLLQLARVLIVVLFIPTASCLPNISSSLKKTLRQTPLPTLGPSYHGLKKRDQTCGDLGDAYPNAIAPVCAGQASVCTFFNQHQGCCDESASCTFYTTCIGGLSGQVCAKGDMSCLSWYV